MKTLLTMAVLVCMTACNSEKDFKVTIALSNPETKETTEEVENIRAANDTAAYQQACKKYWISKASVLKTNKSLSGSLPVPFYFYVEDDKGSPVMFDSATAERITAETTKYFKEKVLPTIDTIVPIRERNKEKPANIY